jgi:hypothetical protein
VPSATLITSRGPVPSAVTLESPDEAPPAAPAPRPVPQPDPYRYQHDAQQPERTSEPTAAFLARIEDFDAVELWKGAIAELDAEDDKARQALRDGGHNPALMKTIDDLLSRRTVYEANAQDVAAERGESIEIPPARPMSELASILRRPSSDIRLQVQSDLTVERGKLSKIDNELRQVERSVSIPAGLIEIQRGESLHVPYTRKFQAVIADARRLAVELGDTFNAGKKVEQLTGADLTVYAGSISSKIQPLFNVHKPRWFLDALVTRLNDIFARQHEQAAAVARLEKLQRTAADLVKFEAVKVIESARGTQKVAELIADTWAAKQKFPQEVQSFVGRLAESDAQLKAIDEEIENLVKRGGDPAGDTFKQFSGRQGEIDTDRVQARTELMAAGKKAAQELVASVIDGDDDARQQLIAVVRSADRGAFPKGFAQDLARCDCSAIVRELLAAESEAL